MIDIILKVLDGLFDLIIDNSELSWFWFAILLAFMIAICAVVVYVRL